ncbi:DUF3103 family protein [Oligoflexus tunisiensis]|uniref:DUF3103 family protein n=1 Tax=Oligoflexus tunisiensis TaxID=708132 RepID=UPI001C401E9A|nr:DUF3103 family protein [Oligoflexus tunisiensis]
MLAALSVACGRHTEQKSAVQSIASTANDKLIADVDAATRANDELKLSEVIAKKDYYGLSDKEVKIIREAFTAEEYNRLVLKFVDPNNKRGLASPQWAFIPDVSDDSGELKEVEVVDKQGRKDLVDGTDNVEALAFPLITLGFSEKIEGAIKLRLADDPAADGGLMLNSLEFSDDHEPWIKGGAEVYGVVSFIGKDGKGTSELVEFPSVDYDGERYDLRQIVHFWPKNRYQIANIAFFEHDSGHNYADLTKIFITAATSIVTSIIDPTQTTTIAIAGIVGQLAGKIVDALPAGTFTDDDDYMDTINTIEKYAPGVRSGVSGNARVEMSLYQVKINDE